MQAPQKKNLRWFMLFLVFLATTINYLDRQVMGLLKPTLEAEFSWTEKDYSYIVMAFTASYALGNLLMGRFVDKVGSKIGYAVSLVVWSLASIGHGFVKSTIGFLFARTALGLSEAGNFPAAIICSGMVSQKRKSFGDRDFQFGSNSRGYFSACFGTVYFRTLRLAGDFCLDWRGRAFMACTLVALLQQTRR